MTKLRIGVVGTGFGKNHVRVFGAHPEATVTALASADPARAAAVASELGVPHAYGGYHAMIAEAPIDAVAVAAPPDLHLPVAAAAFAAGKHVLCEKPLAGTLDDAREMARLARSSGLVHGVAQWFRALPASLLARDLIRDGAIGCPLSAHDQAQMDVWGYHASPAVSPNKRGWFTDPAQSGGFLFASAQHLYDRLLWMFGPVESVRGFVHVAVPEVRLPDGSTVTMRADDSAHAVLRFRDGLTALAQLTPGPWGEHRVRLEVVGGEGVILVEGPAHAPVVKLARRGERAFADVPFPERLLDPRVPAGMNPGLFEMADRFVAAVRDGGSMEPDFGEGLRTQELIDAVARGSAPRDLAGAA